MNENKSDIIYNMMKCRIKRQENLIMDHTTTKELFKWIKNSPTPFHAIAYMKQQLQAEGYQELFEHKEWNILLYSAVYIFL